MSEYNIQMNKYNALNAEYDQLYPKPMKHANTHAKDGSDPITPADIGAYTKTESDTLLANKMSNDLGQASANLLEWASAQTFGGSFIINPAVTTTGVPVVAWYAGLLEVNSAGRKMTITRSSGGAPITYVNVTAAGVWQGWQQFATATDLDTKVSKSGDTMTGDLWLVANENGAVRVSGWDGPNGGKSMTIEASKTGGGKGRLILNSGSYDTSLIFQKYEGDTFYNTWNVLHTGNAQALGFSKIATGSYVGTGTYYSNNPNSLTFDFEPKMLAVVAGGSTPSCAGFLIVRGQTYSNGIGSYSSSSVELNLNITWAGKTVSWWSSNTFDSGKQYAQMNAQDVTYFYVALG